MKFKFPEDFKVAVYEDTSTKLNIVLPDNSEELSEAELEAVAGGLYWGNWCTDKSSCP